MKTIYRKRLAKLADFLDTVPEDQFGMSDFRFEDYCAKDLRTCGTAGCAIGWAPAIMHSAIVDRFRNERGRIDFYDISNHYYNAPVGSMLFLFLFSGGWVDIDNTAKGAAARIRYFLEKGLPSIFKWEILDPKSIDYTELLLGAVEIYKPYIKQNNDSNPTSHP